MVKEKEDGERLADEKEREGRRQEWVKFRHDNLFTQRRLAEIIGIARRTVQMIESGEINHPHPDTLRKFLALKGKYKRRKAA
jgi:DNA-binding XRE family transcriptional regulator